MERTSQTVQTSGQGQEGGAQSATNQVGGVGANVTTLVVGVDGQVQTHELNELVVLAVTELVSQVEGVVLVLLDRSDLAILEDVAVDAGGNGGQLGNEVHGVLEGVGPVVLLVNTLLVGLGEGGLVLESSDGQRELGHGVEVIGAAVDELLNELGDLRTSSPLSGQLADLLLRGDLAGQQKPEETWIALAMFHICFFPLRHVAYLRGGAPRHQGPWAGASGTRGSGIASEYCHCRDIRGRATHGVATESDTLVGIQDGTLYRKSACLLQLRQLGKNVHPPPKRGP